jgi:sulfate/thiosulfate transport system ATP-binding protein
MSIEVRGVSKRFGNFIAVRDVSLHVPAGELIALLGPSGSGKTSLLRIIAGLEAPDAGTVHFDGEDATSRDARDRRVGFVFQHYALFRHMSVFENVAFGLKVRPRRYRLPAAEIRDRVFDLLKMVQLDWLADRYPSQLSGGQRQRVALARALAVEPRVLLLDEPFGSLDAKVRQELRRWLRRLHDTIRLTSVFVTHDQEEALEVADRIVLLNRGGVEQVGTPEEVFERPATPFVMNFLGSVNIFRGRVEAGKALLGPLALDYPSHPHASALPAAGYVRPHDIELDRTGVAERGFWAEVQRLNAAGPLIKLELSHGDESLLQVEISRERYEDLQPQVGERLYVRPRHLRVFLEAGKSDAAVEAHAAS